MHGFRPSLGANRFNYTKAVAFGVYRRVGPIRNLLSVQ